MDAPAIQYVRSADGTSLAYSDTGGDAQPLLFTRNHSNLSWTGAPPPFSRLADAVAEGQRLVRIDARGSGESQRDVHDFSLDALLGDLIAVVEAIGGETVSIMAHSGACFPAIALAATRPSQVSALVLIEPAATGQSMHQGTPAVSHEIARTDFRAASEIIAVRYGARTSDEVKAHADFMDAATSGEAHAARFTAESKMDVQSLLPQVLCPVLIRRFGDGDGYRQVAAEIPSAQVLPETLHGTPLVQVVVSFLDAAIRARDPEQQQTSNAQAVPSLGRTPDNSAQLSRRELEVLAEVAIGKRSAEIAERLTISPATVTRHISNILNKTQLSNRTELGHYAAKHGLVSFDGRGDDQGDAAPTAFRTLMFTDLAASTATTQRLGDAAAQEIVRAHNTIVRDALKTSSGHEIKQTGDGIMAWFPAASNALDCARTIQTIVMETSTGGLAVKIGINAGEPIAEEDDLYGTAVQIAARVTDQAGAGEIVVTNVVRELVTGKAYLFSEREPAALKGVEEPVRLFTLRTET